MRLDPVERGAGIERVVDEKHVPRRNANEATIGRNFNVGRRKSCGDVGARRRGNLVL